MGASWVARMACVALLVFAIVGEETASGKGSPVTFKAEVSKMLDILVNFLYTNRNVFLREIISNGSDALDKIRMLYLTSPKDPRSASGEAPTMDIRIRLDKEKRQFIMRDGGIGMTKEDLEANLGSLGTSGTKRFAELVNKDSKDANYIGQFGVGFYSVFLVSDRVRVASKNDDSEKQWIWESNGDGSYFIYEDERGNTLGRGTELTLDLKLDADDYLDVDKVKEIIHKYSEFIHFPIYIEVEKTEEPSKGEDVEKQGEEEEKNEEKSEPVVTKEWQLINENKPIWTRRPEDITENEYNSFYKSLTKDYENPMYYTHFTAEGELAFKSILFIPGHAPGNLFDTNAVNSNIRLYVRRVFITDDFRDLLPRYLGFIKGVVDSDDLPINVNREVLQESRVLRLIKKKLVRKALTMLAEIADSDAKLKEKGEAEAAEVEDIDDSNNDKTPTGSKKLKEETFPAFWKEYGRSIRLGLIEDAANRARLTKLLRYPSSKSDGKLLSLQEYVDRMPSTQKSIYYISGDSIEKIQQSPVLEDALKRDVEVLYMTDPIDEYVVGHVSDFADKKLVNLAKENGSLADRTDKDKQIDKRRKEKYQPLLKWLKKTLGELVTKVVITKRKTSEALILSSGQNDVTARMANIMRGQALGERQGNIATAKRVMEINHLHPLIDELFKRVQVDENDSTAEDIALVLFDTANLQNGFEIEDSLAFSKRIGRMLRQGVDIAADAPMIEEDVSQYEAEEPEAEASESNGETSEGKDSSAEEL